MIAITAKQARGFWCCAVYHGPARTLHPDGAFDEQQLAELKAEPLLFVEEGLPDPPSGESGGEGASGSQERGGKQGRGSKK